MFLMFHLAIIENLFFAAYWIRNLSVINAQKSINRIMSYLPKISPPFVRDEFFLGYGATICAVKNVSMNIGTMIIALVKYGMRLGMRKQSCGKFFIKSNSVILLNVNSFLLTFVILWVWKDVNEMNGVSM